MKEKLFEHYKDYFNIGTSLNSFFLMNEHDFDLYIKKLSYQLNNLKAKFNTASETNIQIPDIEKIKKDTLEVLNYAHTHFNIIVPENDTKMEYLYKSEDCIDYTWPDKYVDYAKKYNQKFRWHTLVWHNQVAKWIFYDDIDSNKRKFASKKLLERRLQNYISFLGKRYKNHVYSIDVVNECISDKTFKLRDYREKSLWYSILGDTYIRNSFLWTKDAFPNSSLVINDYNLESNPEKREGMYKILKELIAERIPVDTVGLQMHLNIRTPPVEEIEKTIEKFGQLGLNVVVTELDVSIYDDIQEKKKFETQKLVTPDLLELQADRYYEIFECFKQQSKSGILKDVIFWGITDRFSWRNDFPVKGRIDAPLLFDRKGNPKPAFYRLISSRM